jgi:putative transposase
MLGTSWKETIQSLPELCKIDNWPYIDPFDLETHKRKRFTRNRKIAAEMVKGAIGTQVADKYGVSPSYITYLMTRCMSLGDDGYPLLTEVLVPGFNLGKGLRKDDFSSLDDQKGSRGEFKKLLSEVPEIKETFDKMIYAFVRRKKNAQNINPTILRAEMIRILLSKGWSTDLYPLKDASVAYESIRKYLMKAILKFNTPAKKKKRTIYKKRLSTLPFQEIQIDAQTADIHTSVKLEIDGKKYPLRLSRVTLFLAIDVATNCVVAYHICLTRAPTQLDLLILINNIFTRWSPMKLSTPGLEYTDGSSMPNAVIDEPNMIGLNMVSLDNALCHLAATVRFYLCDELGATLNLGLPKSPKRRNFIEYVFHVLNQTIHRFPSTTGSHSRDPKKESSSNSKSPPLLTLKAFEEVLDVVITDYNAKPQKRLASYSPIEMVKQHFETQPVRYNFDYEHKRHEPFFAYKQATIRCIVKENRDPHVSFKGLRYTNSDFTDKTLRGTRVKIKYDLRDIREIEVQTLGGKLITKLNAPRTYQRYKLSINTLNFINELTNEKVKLGKDPVAGVMAHLLRNKTLPQTALRIAHLHRDMMCSTDSIEISTSTKAQNKPDNSTKTSKAKAPRKIGDWFEEFDSNYES